MSLRHILTRIPPVHSPMTFRGILGAALGSHRDAAPHLRAVLVERYGSSDVVLLDSGTSALALALRAAGGAAAVPAFCCFDIATACDAAGVKAVLYDIDPVTLAPDLTSLRRALELGVGSVVLVHLYGVPVPVEAIRSLAAARGAMIIEDAAQATGALLGGRRAGSLGSFGILSFGRGKGVTGGGGGALLVNDADAVRRAHDRHLPIARGSRLPLSRVVAAAAQWLLSRPSAYILPSSLPFLRLGDTVYRAPHPPSDISAFSAALAARSLATEDAEARGRRERARTIKAAVHRLHEGSAVVPGASDGTPGYLRLPLLAMTGRARDRLRSAPSRRLGVLPSYPRSLADLPDFGARATVASADGARALAESLFTVPVHGQVSAGTMEQLESLLGTL